MAKDALVQRLPATFASVSSINNALTTLWMQSLPDDYYQQYAKKIAAITKDDVLRVAKQYVDRRSPRDRHRRRQVGDRRAAQGDRHRADRLLRHRRKSGGDESRSRMSGPREDSGVGTRQSRVRPFRENRMPIRRRLPLTTQLLAVRAPNPEPRQRKFLFPDHRDFSVFRPLHEEEERHHRQEEQPEQPEQIDERQRRGLAGDHA